MTNTAKLIITNDVARVEGVIDFSTVVALQLEGAKWLNEKAPANCTVDLSGVSQCNSVATALLLDWLRIGKKLNKQIKIVQVPQRLRDLMKLAELEDVLSSEVLA
jgi:anti-anti-sigma factor